MMTVYVSKSDPNDKIWAEIDDNPFYKGYYVKLKSDTAPFQVEGDAFETEKRLAIPLALADG